MENQEVLRSKPLSYEASKAVLKSLKLETREAINRRIPALRTVNSRLPYVLENVRIGAKSFQTNGREWFMRPVWVQSSENLLRQVEDPEKWELILQFNEGKEICYRMNKSREEIWYHLFDEYVQSGTVVRGSLRFSGIPECMKGIRENEKDLKMKVTNLELGIYGTKDFDQFIRFIDLDVLENVRIMSFRNSLTLLDNPEIQNCKNLTIYSRYLGRPTNLSIDLFLRLRNQHLKLENIGFPLHELQLFVQDWITTGRDIGTRLSWRRLQSEDILSILEHLKTHLGAVEAGSHLDYYFSNKTIHGKGITLKMGEDRELVMYCGKNNIDSEWEIEYVWVFEMEVVASTIAAGTVPIPMPI
ncbi:hypothetical protein GCK72_007860 [Caenorhabditis remanei]|uniref:F-box associated domain-containing protein n=1 Tax=Caenorhabditis remanei TaxID=31234 RepID=A0A6A5HL92_CAERE|nr:hypothetical protein GCK72_007860 [Caenorhabditis remanei]KAF1767901.1 hypothetical protein GCK72_007860 [Caenorhabditis remanei]